MPERGGLLVLVLTLGQQQQQQQQEGPVEGFCN